MAREISRMAREKNTVTAMAALYCRDHHKAAVLCPDCRELLEYVYLRLEKCPFHSKKPTCAKCTVHCYRPDMRERIRTVMRFSGPRMVYHHPILVIHHLFDGLTEPGSASRDTPTR